MNHKLLRLQEDLTKLHIQAWYQFMHPVDDFSRVTAEAIQNRLEAAIRLYRTDSIIRARVESVVACEMELIQKYMDFDEVIA